VLLKAQAAEKESRVAAERLVRSEQEAVKLKQKHEEALVRLEMVKIRKQLKEKQEREKLVGYIVMCEFAFRGNDLPSCTSDWYPYHEPQF